MIASLFQIDSFDSELARYKQSLEVGPRERRALEILFGQSDVASSVEALAVLHRTIGSAVMEFAKSLRATDKILQWISVPGSGLVNYLDSGSVKVHPEVYQQMLTNIGEEVSVGDAYVRTISADLRHRTGEYYTPSWLVERVVSRHSNEQVFADPACGDGRFITELLKRGCDPHRVWGADLNPLAVLLARFEVWRSLGMPSEVPSVRIEWLDFILHDFDQPERPPRDLPKPSVILGNPPWVTWRSIASSYRKRLAEALADSALNTKRGWEARVSAGQTDIAHLFIHRAIEMVDSEGSVDLILPRSTFKGPVGAAPIRTGVSNTGRYYSYKKVWDIGASDAFSDVRSDTVVALLQVDQQQHYPVPWVTVSKLGIEGPNQGARPSVPSDPESSWLTGETDFHLRLARDERVQDGLRARGGVNTGGGNSVFHVRTSTSTAGNLVKVENIISRRAGMGIFLTAADIERTFLRPLLRGTEIASYSASPKDHIIVPHMSDDLRRPVPESSLISAAPATFSYLMQFHEVLAGRKELARWGGEWYSLFRIGLYTSNCWRVVWPHSSGQRLRAAVLAEDDPTVPDQKVVILPFSRQEEAHFYCAILNSSKLREFVGASSGLDASPGLIKRLDLPAFRSSSRLHIKIVEASMQIWASNGKVDTEELKTVDQLACSLFS